MNSGKTKIVDVICKQLSGVIAIYSFGSWGTQHERTDSDIDLAVLHKGLIDSSRLWNVAQEVARIMGKDVDLVDLLKASTVMRSQVISNSKRLYCSDQSACEIFEDYVYASYARLNEERRDILEDIKQRGTVYGG